MSNTDTSCAGIEGESCAHLGARQDGRWFPENMKIFPRREVYCNPDNQTECFEGTIPPELIVTTQGGIWFQNDLPTTFRVTDGTMLDQGTPDQ
eukprot:CAMPEP_0202825450 /NCGR_PEP_ID=MMETSP1389-20130828/13042_1 /ASSEMBLY_ACC=CAM_ASM_000865 /TAXON_ID=302021 /ORGANISM="Rhodomonas sp., Strain CCMP768" /LENGTH=92 /DNA_ID=CAMNT_0049498683 /DNA_START=38 /DNA_END=313 /DNA_ORIENTATION=+